MKPLTSKDAGAVVRCVFSSTSAFRKGNDYVTECAKDCPHVELDGFVINDHAFRYHKIIGLEGVIASFVVVKDKGGKYRKSQKFMTERLHDNRRARRVFRQAAKIGRDEQLLKLARNHGK
ncbi:hypothetical protein [Hafnia phage Pocis76]|uniref:Uncharacterized protein n=1 Tax=Hafnia phage Pocis76 TaxID=2831174 RepID=A0A8E7FNQ2_9CAUD|nr:hypothetical protein [Hafnia phage Pocis76]